MTQRNQKSLKSLTQVRLEANILLKNLVDKVRLIELEARKVRKVHLQCCLLELLDGLCLLDVEADRPPLLLFAVSVELIVWVVFPQLKPIAI